MKLLLLSTSIISAAAFQPAIVSRVPASSCRPSLVSAPLAMPKTRVFALGMSSEASTTDGEPVKEVVSGGTASIPNEIFNLVKSIVGAGVLSLPAGRFLGLCDMILK